MFKPESVVEIVTNNFNLYTIYLNYIFRNHHSHQYLLLSLYSRLYIHEYICILLCIYIYIYIYWPKSAIIRLNNLPEIRETKNIWKLKRMSSASDSLPSIEYHAIWSTFDQSILQQCYSRHNISTSSIQSVHWYVYEYVHLCLWLYTIVLTYLFFDLGDNFVKS